MVSSENLLAMEQPWGPFCQKFANSWFYDVFSKETDALTKVLQNSFAIPSIENNSSHEILNLRDNRLNGTLTPITQCLNLLIYLFGNNFSGKIPAEFSSLPADPGGSS